MGSMQQLIQHVKTKHVLPDQTTNTQGDTSKTTQALIASQTQIHHPPLTQSARKGYGTFSLHPPPPT